MRCWRHEFCKVEKLWQDKVLRPRCPVKNAFSFKNGSIVDDKVSAKNSYDLWHTPFCYLCATGLQHSCVSFRR